MCILGITKLCDHHGNPRTPTASHNFDDTTHDHVKPAIISPPPLTVSHNFTPATHDYPQSAVFSQPTRTTTHD